MLSVIYNVSNSNFQIIVLHLPPFGDDGGIDADYILNILCNKHNNRKGESTFRYLDLNIHYPVIIFNLYVYNC